MGSVTISTGLAHSQAVQLGSNNKTHLHYMSVEDLNQLLVNKIPVGNIITKATLKIQCYYTLPNAIFDSIYANINLYVKFCNEGSYGSGITLMDIDKIAEDKAGTYTADITSYVTSSGSGGAFFTGNGYSHFYVVTATANVMVRNYYCPVIDLIFEYGPKSIEVNTRIEPEGGGTITGVTGTYKYGDTVTFTANPSPGYRFVQWRYVHTPYTQNPIQIELTGDYAAILSVNTFTAYFEPDTINKLYIDNQVPSKIFANTQEVKKIYIDTIQAYG